LPSFQDGSGSTSVLFRLQDGNKHVYKKTVTIILRMFIEFYL
jgi:hypothetical protein